MESRGRAAITFTLNGRRYDLSREAVATELLGVAPEAIRKHAVRVNNIWFPVIQAFESATGIPRSDFISQTARRHLAALGYEVSGATQPHGNTMPSPETSAGPPTHSNRPEVGPAPPVGEWHTEANVQAALVTALGRRWLADSVGGQHCDQGARHRRDRLPRRANRRVSRSRVSPAATTPIPARAGEVKRTAPSTQAAHWYSQAVLAAMRLRGKEPAWRQPSSRCPGSRDTATFTRRRTESLAAAQIEVWWVNETGTVRHA
jgi:hypothetical protein